jgi:cobalt-zinc-cadmium efflux system outer membrane protein
MSTTQTLFFQNALSITKQKYSTRLCAYTIVLLLGLNSSANGEVSPAKPLVFADLQFAELESRLTDHPALQGLRFRSHAMRERATAASALPDPIISLGLNNVPVADFSFDTFLPTNKSIGIQQSFPNRAGRRAREENATTKSAALEIAASYEFARLRASLITNLIEQARIKQDIALASARDLKYAELQEVIQTEINAGRAVVFRLAQVDIEKADVARDIVNLESELIAVRAEINSLVGTTAATPPPAVYLEHWNGDNLSFHTVRLASANIDIAQTRVAEVRSELGPNWGVGLTYQQRDAGNGGSGSSFEGDDWFSGQITFTVPVWANKKQAPALRAARSEKAAAEMNVSAIARKTEADWRALAATSNAADLSIALFEKKLQALDEKIAASLTTYESGNGDYSPIIDGEIAQLIFRSQIARETARRDIAIVQANSQMVTI